jgi:hypothetical protein
VRSPIGCARRARAPSRSTGLTGLASSAGRISAARRPQPSGASVRGIAAGRRSPSSTSRPAISIVGRPKSQRTSRSCISDQRGRPAADAEALADWELNNRRGARPEPRASIIEKQISQRQADLEGIRTATERVLAGKATYVEQHRSQLTRDAGKATSEARSHYLAAVEALEHARGELLDCRLAERWALTYPDHSANREPQWMSSLARNLTERLTRAGISTSIDAAQLGRLLREDADALAEAFDPEQRAVVEPKSDAATGAAWADSDEGRAAAREDKRKARERYEREWGQVPGW